MVEALKELVETKERLERRAKEQEVRLGEMQKRLIKLEQSREEAKKRLKRLANQLPGN